MHVTKYAALAVLIAAGLAAPASAQEAGTLRQGQHAAKCVLTLGFGGGCDEKTVPLNSPAKTQGADADAGSKPERAKATRVVDNTSTRAQGIHAGKCVLTLGFAKHCDEKIPTADEAAPAPEDTSRLGQMRHAGACVISMGFAGNCDKK